MTLFAPFTICAAALLAGGCLYQYVGALRDRSRLTRDGRWIAIGGGSRLYVLEKGSGSGPTVVFEAGIGATHLNWFRIQHTVSGFARTAAYDRAGLGWSSPCRSARTPANVASELHEMLARAGIEPPYVLVGHSFGGLVVRRFALMYPAEVSSLVLVDPMRCDEWPPVVPARQSEIDRGRQLSAYAIPVALVGLGRLAVAWFFRRISRPTTAPGGTGPASGLTILARVANEVAKMPRPVWPTIAAHWSRPSYYRGIRSHMTAVPDTVREMLDAAPIQGIPVLVLTPAKSTALTSDCLRAIGDNTRQVIVPHSAHWIHLDQPELVIDTIRERVAAGSCVEAELA